MINRRKLLLGLGSFAVVGTGATTWQAVDQGVFSTGSGAAYVAWDERWRTSHLPLDIVA
ncbi:hypothetical protein [Kibdelosporangium philippinense]|uniref:hypothetical protein n=1 Tax=Kibdelosporangium philippinense TaxID=211113 RepID=UPI00361580C9